MKRQYILLCLIFFSLIIACSFIDNSAENNSLSSPILVGAAASLEPVLTKIDDLYSEKVDYTFASSGVLQQQIEQGANIDIFISASDKQINILEEKGLLLPDSIKNLVANQIVLITEKNNLLTIRNFSELTDDKIKLIAIGEPKSVPAGQYAKEILENLNIFNSLESQSKLLFTNNVRGTLTSVESGNVDVGIVYFTDAKSSDKVKVIAIVNNDLHSPIIYPMAIIKNNKNLVKAQQYLQFLQTEEIENIFTDYGFKTIK